MTSNPHQPDTGHPVVDAVLASLGDLDERPVTEHAAVFEQAHQQLREALNDAGSEASAADQG